MHQRRGVADFELIGAEIGHRLGMTPQAARRALTTVYCLDELPQLNRLRETQRWIGLAHLEAIANAIAGAPEHPYKCQIADELLLARLQPWRSNQAVPTPAGLRRWLSNRLEEVLDPLVRTAAAAPEDEAVAPESTYYFGEPGCISLNTTPGTACMIDQILELVATNKGITKAEAMIMLLTEKVDLKVTLNLFGAAQDINEPLDLFVHGVGSLSASEARWALPKVTSVRDIIEAGRIYSEDIHDPVQALKTYAQARDGHCRFPGCEETTNLQFHHVIAFNRGGPTTATNLACVCQHNHNKLTGGAAKMYMSESGVCV